MSEEIKTENTMSEENKAAGAAGEENTSQGTTIVHAKPEEVSVVQPKPVSTVKSIEQIREEETRREEEKGNRKREIIKNIAIIFLAVMLVLTFFSNTIMNFSLPQVSTELITSGTIKSQIRGRGTIEAIDPYNITVKETRTVNRVDVKVGDTVAIGDVIYSLQGEESSELDSQRSSVRKAESAYQSSIITNGLRTDQVLQIEAGAAMNMTEIQNNIAEYDRQIEQYLTEIDTHKANEAMIQLQIDQLTPSKTVDNTSTVVALEKQIIICKDNIVKYEAIIKAYEAKKEHTEEETKQYNDAKEKLPKEQETLANCQKQLDLANEDAKITTNQDVANKINELTNQLNNEKTAEALTTTAKTDTEARKKTYVDSVSGKLDAMSKYSDWQEAKEKLAKLEKDSLGKQITAPVAGKIVSLSKKPGEDTSPNEVVAVIQVEGKGYRTSFTVDASQARTVKVGDIVNVDDYFMSDVKVNLVAINPDKTDPQNKKSLVFELTGDELEAGGTISLSVGDSSSSYNLTVPKSALRKDNKGDFILIIQEKAVPFGTRYYAKRVEVSKIYAQDDSRAAIQADVDDYGVYVISNSTKQIKGGDQVRLSEEQK